VSNSKHRFYSNLLYILIFKIIYKKFYHSVIIILQVVIFLRLLDQIKWPSLAEVCISPLNVYYREDWRRLLLAGFFHADEWHLYYNMVSFLWKGLTLERRFGSFYFAYLLGVFAVLTNVLTVGLSMAAEHLLNDHSYISQCAVGFSGI
jgi:rhomboid domain-containing protein 1